jgi:uncharacterized membrane protein YeaQ/YmgE (transglycosylase-associated protein family)
MSLIDFLLTLAIAVVCGTLAQLTSGYSRGGWIVNLGVGFMGALAGVFVARSLPVPDVYILKVKTSDFPIIWALIGSVFFLAAIGLFVKPDRR